VAALAAVGRLVLDGVEVTSAAAGNGVLLTGICRSMDASADTETTMVRNEMSASASLTMATDGGARQDVGGGGGGERLC